MCVPTIEHHKQPECSGFDQGIPLKQLTSCVSSSAIPRLPHAIVAMLLFAIGTMLAPLPLAAQTLSPPIVTKAFGAASIPLNGGTTLTFTYTNPNSAASLTGIAFTDTLPAGLVVSTPAGLSGSCTPGSGGGSITAASGSGVVSLSNATLAASGSCSFTVTNISGTTVGVKNNAVQITSTDGGAGNTATATVVVTPTTPVTLQNFVID